MLIRTALGDEVDLPIAWLAAAGASDFRPSARCYVHREDPRSFQEDVVPLVAVRPPRRNPGVELLKEDRAVSILRAFANDTPLLPIPVCSKPDGPFLFRPVDGFHRFHLSLAVGFTFAPIVIEPWWEPWRTGDG